MLNCTKPGRLVVSRGHFGEIRSLNDAEGNVISPQTIIGRFTDALPDTFVEFDRAQRGDALNLDLYGYDPVQDVAVVQIRHSFRLYRNGYMNTRKDYVLVGQNEETQEFFRHPVGAAAVHSGIRTDKSDPVAVVRSAQRWMWQVKDDQLALGIRQGDILIVPGRKPGRSYQVEGSVVLVGGTHEVRAHEFRRDGKGVVWAKGPTVRHTKGQHATAFGDSDGWHAIRVAREAPTWEWGERLGD